jgi:beta-phosphoglucomutase-like phosphatase (HAD superfamily)
MDGVLVNSEPNYSKIDKQIFKNLVLTIYCLTMLRGQFQRVHLSMRQVNKPIKLPLYF